MQFKTCLILFLTVLYVNDRSTTFPISLTTDYHDAGVILL